MRLTTQWPQNSQLIVKIGYSMPRLRNHATNESRERFSGVCVCVFFFLFILLIKTNTREKKNYNIFHNLLGWQVLIDALLFVYRLITNTTFIIQ